MKDTWRNLEGFGRPAEVSPRTFSVTGPDEQDHAVACAFITKQGILPCSCDATRKEFSWWWKCWLRWQYARVMRHHSTHPQDRVPWPVEGPDKDPWVPGIDFNNDPAGEVP
jgi:hypothetical protein